MGFYDIDISGLNINNSESIKQWFPTNLKADKDQLEVIAVTADSEHVLLWFKYTTPDGYKSYKPSINPDTHLLDPATGKAYKAVSAKGLPVSPKYLPMSGNKTVGFAIQFESPLKDGVKTFNYVWSPKSTWNINGITLD